MRVQWGFGRARRASCKPAARSISQRELVPARCSGRRLRAGSPPRAVTLTVTLDEGATETWGVAGTPFNVSGGLIFGSATADSPVIFTNSINLNSGNRDIWVNPGVGGDYALISGNLITSSSDTTSNITKDGNGLVDPHGLELLSRGYDDQRRHPPDRQRRQQRNAGIGRGYGQRRVGVRSQRQRPDRFQCHQRQRQPDADRLRHADPFRQQYL